MLRELLDSCYEGDGVFYLAATDGWAVRRRDGDQLRIRIERPGDPPAVLELSAPYDGEVLAVTTLLVESNDDWKVLEERLSSGQAWPVIIPPKPA